MSKSPAPGQDTSRFEKPPPFFLPWAIIGLLIAVIVYLTMGPHPEPMRRVWVPLLIDTNGNESRLGESRQLEFWTPSAKTKDYLHIDSGLVADREKWQVLSNDDAVAQFGAVLHTNQEVFGYRRVEVWGQGRTTFKPGWWWTMNVSTDYTAVDLAHSYQQYWKSSQPVLVEVIDNRGGSDR